MLKATRIAKGTTPHALANLTGLDPRRVLDLEYLSDARLTEPWFDEALILSRALCTDGIAPLITSGSLTLSDCGPPVFDDRLAWRCGLRLPLSAACRLTFAFGLTDPAQLHVDPLLRQLWASIEQNERHPSAAGWCPWCVADIVGGEPHMDTCLGNNLLHARSDPLPAATGSLPRPLKAGTRRTGSAPARGLKALRTSVGLTQVEMAAIAGVVANHYARMERCIVATTLTAADRIASHFAIDVAQVYASTEDAGDVGDNGENP